jgi:hypothetical protein
LKISLQILFINFFPQKLIFLHQQKSSLSSLIHHAKMVQDSGAAIAIIGSGISFIDAEIREKGIEQITIPVFFVGKEILISFSFFIVI